MGMISPKAIEQLQKTVTFAVCDLLLHQMQVNQKFAPLRGKPGMELWPGLKCLSIALDLIGLPDHGPEYSRDWAVNTFLAIPENLTHQQMGAAVRDYSADILKHIEELHRQQASMN